MIDTEGNTQVTFPQFPQFPQQNFGPQFPQQPQPQPQYAPQFPQGYQPQPQQPPVQLANGSLSDFYEQPSVSGGPSISFKDKQVGTTYVGIVERDLIDSDVQQQTQPGSNLPAYYRDGRPKFVLKVPLIVQQSQEFPEGKATWYVTGQSRDELFRAMAEAGVPADRIARGPEKGAAVQIQLVGRKPARTPGFNPANQVAVRYQRPQGAEQAAQPQAQPAQPAPQQAPAQPEVPVQAQPAQLPPGAIQQGPPPNGAFPQGAPQQGQLPQQDQMSPEQQALIARLTGAGS